MKLLEEDEDENMHSGADVEAFQAALNRDIGGDASTSQPSEPEAGDATITKQANAMASHSKLKLIALLIPVILPQLDKDRAMQLQTLYGKLRKNEISKEGFVRLMSGIVGDRTLKKAVTTLRGQKMSNQQAAIIEQANAMASRSKQVPFALLMPVIMPQLDRDRAMQVQTLYVKLRKNEIPKEVFVRLISRIVGDHMLKKAVTTLHSQGAPNQFQLQSQASVPQHHLKMPANGGGNNTQFSGRQTLTQLNLKGQADMSSVPSSTSQSKTESAYTAVENAAKKSQEVERFLGSHRMQVSQMSSPSLSAVKQEGERSSNPIQGLNKQPQQHLHFPQTSFPMYGNHPGGNYEQYTGANVNTSASSLKPQSHDSQMRQIHLGGARQSMNMMSVPNFERQNFNDPKRDQGGSLFQFTSSPAMQQNHGSLMSVNYVKQEPAYQCNEQQQKTQVATPQGLSSISAAQQVDQANAMSGTMRDESLEKQPPRMGFLTSTSTAPPTSVSPLPSQMDSNISKMSNQQATITEQANAMASRSKQVPFALLMPVIMPQLDKDRAMQLQTLYGKRRKNEIPKEIFVRLMRGIVGDQMLKKAVTTLQGQRVDAENPRYRTIIASDVRQQIATLNRKAREEWEKKQAKAEKLRKQNDPEGTPPEVLTQLQQENVALKSQVEVLTAQQEEARAREEALRKKQEDTDAMTRFLYNQMRSANPDMPPFCSPTEF